jgi:hypothetical protein
MTIRSLPQSKSSPTQDPTYVIDFDDLYTAATDTLTLLNAQRYALSGASDGDPLYTGGDDTVGWDRIARLATHLSHYAEALARPTR